MAILVPLSTNWSYLLVDACHMLLTSLAFLSRGYRLILTSTSSDYTGFCWFLIAVEEAAVGASAGFLQLFLPYGSIALRWRPLLDRVGFSGLVGGAIEDHMSQASV